jgi:hypothetical protein
VELTFLLDRLPLPQAEQWHGWGSGLVVTPGEKLVLLSVPSGQRANRLCAVNLAARRAVADESLRGELRDAVFETPDEGWLLTTFALARIDLTDERARVRAEHKPKGLGTYMHRLFALGPRHLGTCGWATKSLAVIERDSGTLVKRVRIAGPHLAIEIAGSVRLYSPHSGETVDLTLPDMTVARRGAMPTGTAPLLDGGELIMLEGDRVAVPHTPLEKVWRVEPHTLTVIDGESLVATRRGPAPNDARDVIGVDRDRHIVISTSTGVVLVDRIDLAEVSRFDVPGLQQPIHTHRWLPTRQAVVILPNRFTTNELLTLAWST